MTFAGQAREHNECSFQTLATVNRTAGNVIKVKSALKDDSVDDDSVTAACQCSVCAPAS